MMIEKEEVVVEIGIEEAVQDHAVVIDIEDINLIIMYLFTIN